MGASTNAAHLGKKIGTLAAIVPAAATATVVKMAATVEAAVGVASGRYRGHAITEVKASVSQAGTESVALVRMTSRKAHLLDHDTHFPAQSSALGVSGDLAPRHGGVRTHGKFMWEKGVAASRPAALKIMGEQVGKAMSKAFH